MRNESKVGSKNERGAALVTVILITLLLGTACIALLSAVGASSKNNTDALSEAKAYWAAESGLQSTINVLRNTPGMTYNVALAQQSVNAFPASGPNSVGTETSYTVQIEDPDASLPYTFYTAGSFRGPVIVPTPNPPVAVAEGGPPARICFPDCTTTNRTEVSFTSVANTNPEPFPIAANYPIGTFAVTKGPAGGVIPPDTTFRIEYYISSPRASSRTIRGKITASTDTSPTAPVGITFDSYEYELMGSQIEICADASVTGTPGDGDMCSSPSAAFTPGTPRQIYANMTDVEPYRLLVTSTGSGPQASQKKLEGVIIKDLVNGLPSTSALTMLGPGANLDFEQGQGGPVYCGHDQGYEPGDTLPQQPTCNPNPTLPSAPSIGVTDQAGLEQVLSDLSNPLPNPMPDIITDGPAWQHSATAMHNYITDLKTRAQIGSTGSLYIPDTSGTTDLGNYTVGNFMQGSGLTFCEGNCSVGPREGGGILVVTGNFEYSGNFDFRGTIIVIGSMHRNGAGNGIILGSVIIAPYDPNNLAAGFGSPSFTTTGGGTSDIIFSGDFGGFDGTAAVTNLMIGVAEK